MKLKRICAFLLMVFALSGCVSDVPLTTLENTNHAANAAQMPQLTHRNNAKAALDTKAIATSLKEEVQSYTISKKLNTKLVKRTSVQTSLKVIKEKSQASQYEVKKPIQEVETETTASGGEFNVQTTLYGVDCYGCNVREDGTGNTATGVMLNPSLGVMQSDGTWLSGLTYDGYYVIAMDASIPFYSIVEISNHGLSGMGFSPDQPIRCIVLDRGGAIQGNHIDLYIGSEANVNQISYNGSQATAKIIRYGK